MKKVSLKKFLGIGLSLVLGLGLVGCGSTQPASSGKTSSENKEVKIGIVQIVEHPALDSAREGFLDTLKKNGYEEGMGMMQQGMMGQQAMTPGMLGPQFPPGGFVTLDPEFAPGAVTLDAGYPCPPVQAVGGMHHHCPTPAPLPSPCPHSYVVKKGDSVYKIAQRFGTTMQAIILANNLTNPDLIYPGQVLLIPCV